MDSYEINRIQEKADKWDVLNNEIYKFYLAKSSRWREKNSMENDDFAELGLLVAIFVGWEDKERKLNP